MPSLDKPEPVKLSLELASTPSFLLIKMLKFELELSSSLSEKIKNVDRAGTDKLSSFGPEADLLQA